MTCVPCSIENVQIKAAYFCQTCEKPEPLCETCATQYTRQTQYEQRFFEIFQTSINFWVFCIFFPLLFAMLLESIFRI